MTTPPSATPRFATLPPLDLSAAIKVHRETFHTFFEEVHRETVDGDVATIHYYALATDRHGSPRISDLIDWLFDHVALYVFHNRRVEETGGDSRKLTRVALQALEKFQSKKGDEGGEFLLWAFLEAILGAPQAVAKMSHKTNFDMPVHGADAVHARWAEGDRRLTLLLGESKLHKTASSCIGDAFKSLEEALTDAGIQKEKTLLTDYPSQLSPGLEEALRAWWTGEPCDFEVDLAYAFLLGFDLPAYKQLLEKKFEDPCGHVLNEYTAYHKNLKNMFCGRLPLKGRKPTQELYVFFLPFHSVEEFRSAFLAARKGKPRG